MSGGERGWRGERGDGWGRKRMSGGERGNEWWGKGMGGEREEMGDGESGRGTEGVRCRDKQGLKKLRKIN